MKVDLKISPDIKEPYIEIYADKVTDEIRELIDKLSASDNVITVTENDRIFVLKPSDIYMLRIEEEQLIVYCQQKKYFSGKRLYEMKNRLGDSFMQISKSTVINLKQLNQVEYSFNGTMLVLLKNGLKDYISRKYLPELKKYLGL